MLKKFMLLALVLACICPVAAAQCPPGDDGFNLGCCTLPQPNLPNFPSVTVPGLYACLQNCSLSNEWKVDVNVSTPQFFLCDTAFITMTITPVTPGAPTITGRFIAKYSRTWISAFQNGTQTWRFLLNGDWSYQGPTIGTISCPVPPHGNPVHATGSIDYACDPTTGLPSRAALNLSHMPGCISHGFDSVRPVPNAQLHNDHSYHVVAPRDFNWVAPNDIAGDFRRDAVRPARVGNCFPSTYTCLNETRVRDGRLTSLFKNCLCTSLSGGPWIHQRIEARVDCNGVVGAFKSVSGVHPSIPTGLAGLRLGSWTNGNVWPGKLDLTVYVGYMVYDDPCGLSTDNILHRVVGVGTAGVKGWFISPLPVIETHNAFLDLADCLIPSNTSTNPIPVPSPIFPVPCVGLIRAHGAPAYSSMVWQVNPQ